MTFLRLNAKRLGTTEFDIPYNRQELADFLCVDRTGLSAEISKLVREGVLETNKKHFKLL